MTKSVSQLAIATTLASGCIGTPTLAASVPVNSDNFVRAESDLYFSNTAARYGLGKIGHERAMAPVEAQPIIRLNRDTLYSGGVFDLDAGPVVLTMPSPGKRFMSLQVIDEDHFTRGVYYTGGTYTFTKNVIGTRYLFLGIRTLANPDDPADLKQVHGLQDQMKVVQPGGPGKLDLPAWDKASQDVTRSALLTLAAGLPDTKGMFGPANKVTPVRHLIGSAMGWGGNPETEALYLNRVVGKNDGKTIYRVTVGKVPVQGFWSISVYNADGYYAPNVRNAYTVNNLTAKAGEDGRVTVQFGGCDQSTPNCLPTPAGWNWMVRLYRPKSAILDGSWVFPDAEEVK